MLLQPPLTSLSDYETDEIIQKSLREELGKDVTLLTIAHRLQTIMDADKIVSAARYLEPAVLVLIHSPH